jgi:hypothetical protein
LQFVVVALVSERPPLRAADAGAAFGTPNIVHFGAVLLLSAFLLAPWGTITILGALWGLMGVSGVVYAVIVARRMRRQDVYRPVFEDWLCHAVLPVAAYATLALSPLAASSHTRGTLFAVGAAARCCSSSASTTPGTPSYHVFVNREDPTTGALRPPSASVGSLRL